MIEAYATQSMKSHKKMLYLKNCCCCCCCCCCCGCCRGRGRRPRRRRCCCCCCCRLWSLYLYYTYVYIDRYHYIDIANAYLWGLMVYVNYINKYVIYFIYVYIEHCRCNCIKTYGNLNRFQFVRFDLCLCCTHINSYITIFTTTWKWLNMNMNT